MRVTRWPWQSPPGSLPVSRRRSPPSVPRLRRASTSIRRAACRRNTRSNCAKASRRRCRSRTSATSTRPRKASSPSRHFMKIMADAGNVAWDMGSYQWLLQGKDFQSIHPSLQRQAVLNMAYGLYEVRAGQDLSGARLRPGQHQLHQGRHRLDRLRPAHGQGNRAGGARVHQRQAGQAPGPRVSSTRTPTSITSAACAAWSTRPTSSAARSRSSRPRASCRPRSRRTSSPATRCRGARSTPTRCCCRATRSDTSTSRSARTWRAATSV